MYPIHACKDMKYILVIANYSLHFEFFYLHLKKDFLISTIICNKDTLTESKLTLHCILKCETTLTQ